MRNVVRTFLPVKVGVALSLAALHSVAESQTLAASAFVASSTPIQQCILVGSRLNVSTDTCDGLKGGSLVGKSPKGVPIYAFNAGASAERAEMRVLVLGAIHGDETSSGWLPYLWLSDPAMQQAAPRKIAVRVLPITNPDAALATATRRVNSNGVDLNRNFPTENWANESRKWWQDVANRDPRRWPGNHPASELETKLIIQEIDRFKPSVVVSVHAPYGVLDFDGHGVTPPQRIGSLRLDLVGVYPGSLGNYGSFIRGVPVVTLELPAALRATSRKEAQTMWGDLVGWMNRNARTMVATTQKKVNAQ